MEERINKWKVVRMHTISELTRLADELDEVEQKVNISRVIGTASSIAFGIGSAVAGIVSIFTSGVAIPVSIGLGIAAGTGGATTVLSAIVKLIKVKRTIKRAQKVKDRDDEETKELRNFFHELMKLEKIEKENSGTTVGGLASGFVSGASEVNTALSIASKWGPDILRIFGNIGDDVLTESGRVFATLGQVTKIAGPVLGLVIVPFELYTLITVSIDLHKEKPNKIAVKLHQHAHILQNQLYSVLPEVKIQKY